MAWDSARDMVRIFRRTVAGAPGAVDSAVLEDQPRRPAVVLQRLSPHAREFEALRAEAAKLPHSMAPWLSIAARTDRRLHCRNWIRSGVPAEVGDGGCGESAVVSGGGNRAGFRRPPGTALWNGGGRREYLGMS